MNEDGTRMDDAVQAKKMMLAYLEEAKKLITSDIKTLFNDKVASENAIERLLCKFLFHF